MSKLLAKLQKNTTLKHVDTMAHSTFFNDRDVVSTDVVMLNIALHGSIHGGVTPGLTTIAAPSAHFKSLLGLFMVAAYMKKYKDAVCIFYDSEFGSPPEYLKNYDIDIDRVLHCPVTSLEDLRTDMAVQIKEINRGDKVIIFIDSVGNLASLKETKDAEEGNSAADFTRAKVLKSTFRIVTPQFLLKDIPCICINQVYDSMDKYNPHTMSGGCVVEGTKIRMANGELKEIQHIVPGDMVKTLTGSAEVSHSWNPDTLEEGTPECFELEFDDGFKVITSSNHKFLCSQGDQFAWVKAKDLNETDDIVSI